MRAMKDRLADQLDCVLVVHDTGYLEQRQPAKDIRDLRRVARVDWPILLETAPGIASLGNRFTIALLDKQRGEIIYRYYPDSTRDDLWPRFERTVTQLIDAN